MVSSNEHPATEAAGHGSNGVSGPDGVPGGGQGLQGGAETEDRQQLETPAASGGRAGDAGNTGTAHGTWSDAEIRAGLGGDPVRKVWVPHRYQQTAEKFIYERTVGNGGKPGGAGLFLDPGMGKTAVCLNAISTLKQLGFITRALVIAPKRVCQKVWPAEVEEWENFKNLSIGVADGPAPRRRKILQMPFDVHVVSRDNLEWLNSIVTPKKKSLLVPWQLIIIDESTSFKTWSAKRSKELRKLIPRIPYRVLLTGTPAPNGLMDLFAQIWLLDEGESLGENITRFRERYCMPEGNHKIMKFRVREGMEHAIRERVKHLCLRLDIQDYLSMPPITTQDIWVDLPPAARETYDLMEEELFVSLEGQGERDITCAAALYQACKQVANGGLYTNDRMAPPMSVHDEKLDATLEILEELNGKPALIAYQYEHDVTRLAKRIQRFRGRRTDQLHIIKGGTKRADFERMIDQWNAGTLDPPYLAVQPQALSYGINMQKGPGRDIIWMGLTDSLEQYEQLNARLWRQGVGSAVRIHRIAASNTVDEMVVNRINGKKDTQTSMLEALREYAKQRG